MKILQKFIQLPNHTKNRRKMYISPIMITDQSLCTVDSLGAYYYYIFVFTSSVPESNMIFCDCKVLNVHSYICHKLFTFSNYCSVLLHDQSSNLPLVSWSWRNVVSFLIDFRSKMADLASDWLGHFQLLFQNCCMPSHQIYQKCYSWGS